MEATQVQKEQYATCEECERLCYTGGEHKEEYICEDCEEEEQEEDIVFSCEDCGTDIVRNSREHDDCWCNNDDEWFCGKCKEKAMEKEDDEELAYDCVVCKKHLYITEMAKCEWRELCAECCVGPNRRDCDCYVCVANN